MNIKFLLPLLFTILTSTSLFCENVPTRILEYGAKEITNVVKEGVEKVIIDKDGNIVDRYLIKNKPTLSLFKQIIEKTIVQHPVLTAISTAAGLTALLFLISRASTKTEETQEEGGRSVIIYSKK
jgi:hypothetical protein